jgi:hypothetical protein
LCHATGGHPLLVSSAIDALEADLGDSQRWTDRETAHALAVLDGAMTLGLRCQIDRLSADDRILLETAAVIGATFTASQAAAGLDCEHVGPIGRRLDLLVAGRTLIDVAPDGPMPERTYRFRHASAADLLTEPLPLSRVVEVAARVRRSADRLGPTGRPGPTIRAAK